MLRPAGHIAPLLAPWAGRLVRTPSRSGRHEGAGLPDEGERSADARIRIPIPAAIESLNAAAALPVLFYERPPAAPARKSALYEHRQSKVAEPIRLCAKMAARDYCSLLPVGMFRRSNFLQPRPSSATKIRYRSQKPTES